jgi:hypothetical protein
MRIPEPLTVTCDSCGKSAETYDGMHPDRALDCGCCAERHDHAGLGCRPVTVSARVRLTLFDAGDLMDIAEMHSPASIPMPFLTSPHH